MGSGSVILAYFVARALHGSEAAGLLSAFITCFCNRPHIGERTHCYVQGKCWWRCALAALGMAVAPLPPQQSVPRRFLSMGRPEYACELAGACVRCDGRLSLPSRSHGVLVSETTPLCTAILAASSSSFHYLPPKPNTHAGLIEPAALRRPTNIRASPASACSRPLPCGTYHIRCWARTLGHVAPRCTSTHPSRWLLHCGRPCLHALWVGVVRPACL
jgi:hypothetical protein